MTNEIAVNTHDLIFTTESGSVCADDPRFIQSNINKVDLVIFFEFILKNKVSIASLNSYKFIFKRADCDKISHRISNFELLISLGKKVKSVRVKYPIQKNTQPQKDSLLITK